jgi:hypothetical protein
MSPLDPGRVAWLLRELEVAAVVAMRRAAPHLSQRQWLKHHLPQADLTHDAAAQLRLARHLGLRGKLRQRESDLFVLVDQLRRCPPADFSQVLQAVSALTGQVEKSVASEIYSLFDPEAPVIDRELRELLPRYGFALLAEAPSLQQCLQWHDALGRLLTQVLTAPLWPNTRQRLLAHLEPELMQDLGDLRLLNTALSHARRTIALIPVPRAAAVAAAELSGQF